MFRQCYEDIFVNISLDYRHFCKFALITQNCNLKKRVQSSMPLTAGANTTQLSTRKFFEFSRQNAVVGHFEIGARPQFQNDPLPKMHMSTSQRPDPGSSDLEFTLDLPDGKGFRSVEPATTFEMQIKLCEWWLPYWNSAPGAEERRLSRKIAVPFVLSN